MSGRAALLSSIAIAGLLSTMTPTPARTMTNDKLTFLTFSASVQVPGARLDAGTYRFRLADPDTTRNVIQVLSHNGSTVYAMFHTIPDSRPTVTPESTVTFRETPAGVPPAIKSLFYGGEHRGYEFVYPKSGLAITLEQAPQPVLAVKPAPAAEPVATEAAASPEPAPPPAPEPSPRAAAPEPPAPPPALPKTASPLPLVALSGFASLFVGLGAGFLRRFVQ